MKCGRPLTSYGNEYCGSCRKTDNLFTAGFAPFVYREQIQSSLMRLKYGGRAEYARFYAAVICSYGEKKLRFWKPEVILPVPVHWKRWIERGYNQAEELGRYLSAGLGIPMYPDLVKRTRSTRAQKGLTPRERKKNLEGAFSLDPDAVRAITAGGMKFPERILICDDIYTTGATVNAIASELKKGGAREIFFASISIAPGED